MRTLKRFALCLLALFCCVLPVNAAAQSLAAEQQLNAWYTLMTLSLSEGDFEAALDYADQCLEMDELLDELEAIVYSGTKLNLDYYIDQNLDDDTVSDIYDYFMEEAESDSIEDAMKELGSGYEEFEVRLVRLKFLCEVAN